MDDLIVVEYHLTLGPQWERKTEREAIQVVQRVVERTRFEKPVLLHLPKNRKSLIIRRGKPPRVVPHL